MLELKKQKLEEIRNFMAEPMPFDEIAAHQKRYQSLHEEKSREREEKKLKLLEEIRERDESIRVARIIEEDRERKESE
eukprot:CAMPEP_0170549356 /NCGR_PEP_ID=MMETSP0211-20121228/7513_1 /TAXON_ID=311385 /ORGANISM="Pseudokeronopsis sp., Strain OXSARD2" /LENGTH=77 /DNA_ID=CAMNT_0010855313 /DNA_START=136 /DNA_END=369 /DNA_ORIENTATION=-